MKIFLRPISLSDSKFIVQWRNEKSVKEHCFSKTDVTEESNKGFFHAYIETGKYKQFMVERIEEEFGLTVYPIATVYLKDMDYDNRRCELCVFTSNDQEWVSESQAVAVNLLVQKAFAEYGMHKVYSYVFSKYPKEILLLQNLGFTIETVLKNEVISEDGDYQDVVRLCIFNNQN